MKVSPDIISGGISSIPTIPARTRIVAQTIRSRRCSKMLESAFFRRYIDNTFITQIDYDVCNLEHGMVISVGLLRIKPMNVDNMQALARNCLRPTLT